MKDFDDAKISGFTSLLKEAENILIVTHARPDGDAVGSCVALRSFVRTFCKARATIVAAEALSENLSFLLKGGPVLTTIPDEERFDLMVGLDISGFDRCSYLEDRLRAMDVRKVLVDHHLSPAVEDFDICFSDQDVSSTCELLYYLLKTIWGPDKALPGDCAQALMTGMTTDTNNFANSVFPSTLRMAAELIEAGVDRDSIISNLYNNFRENRLRAVSRLLSHDMRITPEGCAYVIVSKRVWRHFHLMEGELEGLVNFPLSIGKVRMSVYLREDDGFYRVSIRSKKGVSANGLAKKYFNGGGHEMASGGKLFFPKDIAAKADAAAYIEKTSAEFLRRHGMCSKKQDDVQIR